MGKKEGTYYKTLRALQQRKKKKQEEIEAIEQEFLKVVKDERQFWKKQGHCSICFAEGKTEWHHIISQHRCREINKEYLIHSRSNVVEVCKECHDNTTASLRRAAFEEKGITQTKTVKNHNGPVTDAQRNYIIKLGGEASIREDMTRGEASALIDALKEVKE
jgi:thiaminase